MPVIVRNPFYHTNTENRLTSSITTGMSSWDSNGSVGFTLSCWNYSTTKIQTIILLTNSLIYGSNLAPKRSVDSRGSCAGMLSMDDITIPGPDMLVAQTHMGYDMIKVQLTCLSETLLCVHYTEQTESQLMCIVT